MRSVVLGGILGHQGYCYDMEFFVAQRVTVYLWHSGGGGEDEQRTFQTWSWHRAEENWKAHHVDAEMTRRQVNTINNIKDVESV